MTWMNAPKIDLSTWCFLHVHLKKTLFVNPPLVGSPQIDLLIDLIVAKIGLLCFDNLLQSADGVAENIIPKP
jgi:hypothetical protein